MAATAPAAACGWAACSDGSDPNSDASLVVDAAAERLDAGLSFPESAALDSYVDWCDAGAPEYVAMANQCFTYLYVPCGLPIGDYVTNEGGSINRCDQVCLGYAGFNCELLSDATVGVLLSALPDGSPFADFDVAAAPNGAIFISCDCYGGGRRPAGLRHARVRASSSAGAYFARMAHLEAASVVAFEHMATHLRRLRAPRSLRVRAARAIRDERRHARAMERLARRFCAVVPRVRLREMRERSLERVAVENAVEGCVRETYGALVAAWQATYARDPAIRRVMRVIARDELQHAALSMDVGTFLTKKLVPPARVRVAQASRGAIREIVEQTPALAEGEVAHFLGLPTPFQARQLLAGLVSTVWSELITGVNA